MGDSGLSAEGLHSFRAALATSQGKGDEWWARAEGRTAELIAAIQPTAASEQRREAVVAYITHLIKSACPKCEVVRFGSVPLKTYLPDGDIDLTVVSANPEAKRTWFEDVRNAVYREMANPSAEFRVTEVYGVPDAEVKLLKIYVARLLVDVSFDQLGGVCTLCFLEEVDRLIGDDHLFKRSIILVKAWCYYESRLLDAANNLMSTYALETLVLYIFHIFHASIRGPLQVLYLFLEFFSGFDWDKYCVSLVSPVLLASFTEERPEENRALSPRRDGESELLFTKAFLDACERAYGGLVPANQRSKPSKFAVKSLNIIDPLRSTNNLGRSVNQGNFARIRRAFVHGARTMRRILHASEADVSAELNQFFKNCTLRSNQRLDVAVPNGVQKTDSRNGSVSDSTLTREALDSRFEAALNSEDTKIKQDCSLEMDQLPVAVDELCPGIFNERKGAGQKARGKLERRDFLVASKHGTAANGNCTNGSTSSSRADSEEEEECSSQSSSKGEEGSLPLGKEGLLPLPCGPESFESTSSQENPAGSTSDFAFQTEAQIRKQKVNDELSEAHKQTGNDCEYSSKMRSSSRKAKQNGKDPEDKSKRGSGNAKGAWSFEDGREKGQVSSPLPFQHVHPHFKNLQSRPYLHATGPGSFRHPLVNYQFDPGTARMNGSSPPPQYLLSFYPGYAPMGMFPPYMYSPGMNLHKRNSPAKSRTGQDTNEVAAENSGDSPRPKSQPKPSEQVTVGILERLEAEGVMASTSSKRVAASNSEFLTGDLKLHLHSLAYGPMCEYSCSPSLSQIIHAEQKHGSWEGPGRPEMRPAPQFYASGWLQPFPPQSGYFPYLQPVWGTRGVELSPRPKGTGTYLPNTQLRHNHNNNNRPSGRSQSRGQNGSAQQHQEDRHLHESNGHHFHGSHNRPVESRTGKTERAHHPPKHQASPPVADPVEAPQPSELMLGEFSSVSCDDTSVVEGNGNSEEVPGMAVEVLSPGDAQGGRRGSSQLTRSASVGHSYDLVAPEETATISSLPIAIGEVIPTTTTPRAVRPTYHMKEEDFPPLGSRNHRNQHVEITAGGTFANVIASNLGSYVSL